MGQRGQEFELEGIGRENVEKEIDVEAGSGTHTTTSFIRKMDQRCPQGMFQDSLMPDARTERRLYRIAFLVLDSRSDPKSI